MKTMLAMVGALAVSAALSVNLMNVASRWTATVGGVAALTAPSALSAPDADAKLCELQQQSLDVARYAAGQATDAVAADPAMSSTTAADFDADATRLRHAAHAVPECQP